MSHNGSGPLAQAVDRLIVQVADLQERIEKLEAKKGDKRKPRKPKKPKD